MPIPETENGAKSETHQRYAVRITDRPSWAKGKGVKKFLGDIFTTQKVGIIADEHGKPVHTLDAAQAFSKRIASLHSSSARTELLKLS